MEPKTTKIIVFALLLSFVLAIGGYFGYHGYEVWRQDRLNRQAREHLAKDGGTTINRVMMRVEVKGAHEIEVRDEDGKKDKATLEIKFERMRVLPPIGKQAAYPELELTVLHA